MAPVLHHSQTLASNDMMAAPESVCLFVSLHRNTLTQGNSGKLRATVDSLRFPLVDALINFCMRSETGALANVQGSVVICK